MALGQHEVGRGGRPNGPVTLLGSWAKRRRGGIEGVWPKKERKGFPNYD
jgi:hypothetical protein